ncbi:hypothetical protein NDU88_002344 [Pleurodeles waltl]|uniref:Uncharacterized protein n=1 Tax=Pleurodeles waltl TaxID=8319 RepID=A0AAV7VE74_PLEWA|nr:hypothetical protein NDU88_002344 [Pleurodeles waltl]
MQPDALDLPGGQLRVIGETCPVASGGILGPGVQAGVPHWSAATGYLQLCLTVRCWQETAFGVCCAAFLPCCDVLVLPHWSE